MPMYTDFAHRYAETGFTFDGVPESWRSSCSSSASRVKFDLTLRHGTIAAAGDRHLAEFAPTPYLKDPSTVEQWKFHLTPMSYRHKEVKRRAEVACAMHCDAITVKPSGEEGVRILHALLGLGDLITNVNVPNIGQVSNLPLGAVVETNAVISRDNVRPIAAGAIASPLVGLVARHVANQEAAVTAGMTADRELALRVMMNDPLSAHLSRRDAQLLFDEMLLSNAETAQSVPAHV